MLLVLSLLSPAAHAGDAPPPPIVNGSATSDFPQVITLWAANSRGDGYNFCSGTLIAPGWVLTAAHCVVAMDDELPTYGLDYFYVIVGSDLNSSSGIDEYVQAASWTANPNYDDVSLTDDVGIIELETPITDIPFMPVNKDPITNSDVGDDIRYVVVDEYQDVNPLQERLVRGLVRFGANLCVVGDDDQTIYQWRGSAGTRNGA